MKALLNPLLLLLCILLSAWGYVSSASGGAGTGLAETWALTLCLLGIIINGTLGTARAMTGQPSVSLVGWAVGFLVFGSLLWTLVSAEGMESISSQERVLLHERVEAWRLGQLDPCAVDESGDGVLVLAAGLGERELLRELLAERKGMATDAAPWALAAHRATERNRDEVLRLLVAAGMSPRISLHGMEPLHTAAMHRARRAAACLLELGADANAAMADGATPLHLAVLADDAAMVRLLMQHGADPSRVDADGRDAASYARSESLIEALIPPPSAELSAP